MELIQPTYEIVSCPDDALEQIELAARTCYKSERKITGPESAANLVRHLVERGHWPMIEFGGQLHVKFISNRGFTHELVRHRLASYAQESTRYCNYSKDRFGGSVTNIAGETMIERFSDAETFNLYLEGLEACFTFCEEWYTKMTKGGVPAELAREVLNIGLKAEINIKTNLVHWRHIFTMRTSKKAHPRMRELMIPLLLEVRSRIPIVFDDLLEKVEIPNVQRNLFDE